MCDQHNGKNPMTQDQIIAAEAKKRKKIQDNRMENTNCGSDVLSAHMRLTKRTHKEQLEEKINKIIRYICKKTNVYLIFKIYLN